MTMADVIMNAIMAVGYLVITGSATYMMLKEEKNRHEKIHTRRS